MLKTQEILHADIVRLESEINNLWGELNTVNIPQAVRLELEKQLQGCEENFKAVLAGQAPIRDLETNLINCDKALAFAVIQQAENEIPKIEKTSSVYLALQNIRHELNEGKIKPVRARHEVKDIVRHHR